MFFLQALGIVGFTEMHAVVPDVLSTTLTVKAAVGATTITVKDNVMDKWKVGYLCVNINYDTDYDLTFILSKISTICRISFTSILVSQPSRFETRSRLC